ncbi:hypothetical protein VPH35_001082 [Triticum aestivum]
MTPCQPSHTSPSFPPADKSNPRPPLPLPQTLASFFPPTRRHSRPAPTRAPPSPRRHRSRGHRPSLVAELSPGAPPSSSSSTASLDSSGAAPYARHRGRPHRVHRRCPPSSPRLQSASGLPDLAYFDYMGEIELEATGTPAASPSSTFIRLGRRCRRQRRPPLLLLNHRRYPLRSLHPEADDDAVIDYFTDDPSFLSEQPGKPHFLIIPISSIPFSHACIKFFYCYCLLIFSCIACFCNLLIVTLPAYPKLLSIGWLVIHQ